MASQFYGHAGFAFVGWKPAKDQLRDMLERMGVKVNAILDLPLSFGGTRLEVYLETPGMNLSDLIASLENHRAGVNISVSFYSGTPDATPPALPWYSKLPEPQNPPTDSVKIYCNKMRVNIYLSARADIPPADIPPALTDVNRVKSLGEALDVWHKPIQASKWICVYDGARDDPPRDSFVLWVFADDVRETP